MVNNMMQQGSFHIYLKERKSKKINIVIEAAENGMVVAEDIYNRMGAVVVGINAILDKNIIERLKRLGISEIKVFEKNGDPEAADTDKIFLDKYMKNVVLIRDIMLDVQEGKPIDERKVDLVTDSILEKDIQYKDIIREIYDGASASKYEYTHCVNVSMLSMLIGKCMGVDGKRLELLVKTALMHDIGKCKISESILGKRSVLTPEELVEVRKHPWYGSELLRSINWFVGEAYEGVVKHHEREDGSGYPRGLKGESIGEFAKIIAVADVFDAMTSDKAYKNKSNPFDVFEYMEGEAKEKMNPRVVSAFIQNAAECYIGDMFFLDNGDQCEIIHINPKAVSKPIVRIQDMYVDLSKDQTYKIQKIV